MGSSTAYHLMRADNSLKVCLIEKDPLYEHASSMLSMANVRGQFGLKENIQISQYTLDCLEGFAEEMEVDGEKPDIGHRKEANLFVVDEQGEAESLRSLELQKSLGCKVEWWSPRQIVERYPLYDPGPYVGGTFGTEDGYLDPYAVVMGYKKSRFTTKTGGLILVGKSMDDDSIGFDFRWDDKRFYELLWPELAEFVPAFDTLKLMRGWAGLYAVSMLDDNAFIGEWFDLKNYYLANGFSGHGLQQAPAVGRYLSELILGLPPKLDLSIFKPDRIIDGDAIREDAWAIK